NVDAVSAKLSLSRHSTIAHLPAIVTEHLRMRFWHEDNFSGLRRRVSVSVPSSRISPEPESSSRSAAVTGTYSEPAKREEPVSDHESVPKLDTRHIGPSIPAGRLG